MSEEPNERFEVGAVIGGRFRLDALLGHGGMGEVWAATHEITEQRRALKVLKSGRDSAALRRRFLREARAASRVKHPNVIAIQDVFELDDGAPVMVMDLLEGETLREVLRHRESLSLPEAAELMIPVIEATRAAHECGIVHRDLKPENVFVVAGETGPERVRVLDFGIAKLTEPGDGGTMTDTGQLLGTPLYMSPEQLVGETDIDGTTDVWAIGVILYELLTGGRPIEAGHPGRMLKAIMEEGHMPIDGVLPDLPPDVAAAIERALSEERTDRPSLDELAAALQDHVGDAVPSSASAAVASGSEQATTELAPLELAPKAPAPRELAPHVMQPDEPSPRRSWLALAAVAVVGVVAVAATQWGSEAPPTEPVESAPSTSATVAPTPTAEPEPAAPPTASTSTATSQPADAPSPVAPEPAPRPSAKPRPPTLRPEPVVEPTATSSDYTGGVVEEPPD